MGDENEVDGSEHPPMDLRPDGTVRWDIEGTIITMRRPRFGEFRAFREALYEREQTQQEISALTKEIVRLVQERGDAAVDEVRPIRAKISALTASVETADLALIRRIFDKLGDKPLPPDDDLPSWFIESSRLLADLFSHWRNRPLLYGVS